jgi:single-stranded-DNA-specific exonuclease
MGLAGQLGISPVTARVLINRGVKTSNEALLFLHPNLTQLHDPFLLADMDKAVARVMEAIGRGERIAIYGDYDTDGVTSTALLVKFFGMIGVETRHYIPHRINEGYGLHRSAVDELHNIGAKLIITVDNGINAVEQVAHAGRLGMDVIITDHHEPVGRLPNAAAVVNPKRGDCRFPFKDLAGVGVAFNLVMAVRQGLREAGYFKDRKEPRLKELLDIVAIGTIADVVPLVGENRIFVKFGLEEIKKSSNVGVNALKVASGLEQHQINATTIAFRIAPRINAAGRVDDQNLGFRLLVTNNPEEAMDIAQRLNAINSKRQTIEADIIKEAGRLVGEISSFETVLGLVLSKEGWHPGVLGIVAARLAETHKRPVAVIGTSGGVAKGSVRSVGEYNVVEALSKCSDFMESFGGHRHAAGIKMMHDKVEDFARRFNEVVTETLDPRDRIDHMMVDAEVRAEDVTEELIAELELLEPFGEGNPEPTFCLREMKVSDSRIVGEKHLKLKFSDNMVVLEGIGFGMAHHEVETEDVLDVAFVPQRDTWRGAGAVQLKLRDVKSHHGEPVEG